MQLIQDRRTLHQIPELDRNLPETMDYLKNSLAPLGLPLVMTRSFGIWSSRPSG